MILEKETFEKFGYYPSNLLNGSGKRILYRCKKCKNKIETSKVAFNKNRSKCCISCTASITGRLSKAILKTYIPFSNNELCGLLLCGSIGLGKDCINKRLYLSSKKYTAGNIKISPALALITLAKQLNISTQELNTINMKDKISRLLLSRPIKEVFEMIVFIFEKHQKLYESKNDKCAGANSWYGFSDTKNRIRPFLDRVGFKYKVYHDGRSVRIVSGSFYIDNQWIHVG